MKFISCLTKELEKLMYAHPTIIKLWKKCYYEKIIAKEIELGKISKGDQVLCIGGGAIPFTALDIATKTGASVSIVEVDPHAAEKARQLIDRASLSSRIEVIHSSGQDFDASKYSVVHIASQVCPADKVLSNVWKCLSCGSKILFRCDKRKYNRYYDKSKLPNHNYQFMQVKQNSLLMKATFLIIKEDGVKTDETYSGNFSSFATDTTSVMAS
ncbi:MAG: nicotianamine synthase family protein [Alkaliphilus sp.]